MNVILRQIPREAIHPPVYPSLAGGQLTFMLIFSNFALILAILPGQNDYTRNIDGSRCMAYIPGMGSGLKIDYNSLYICFDSGDRIITAGPVRD